MDILTQQVGGAGSAVADQEAPFELQQDPGVARSAGGGGGRVELPAHRCLLPELLPDPRIKPSTDAASLQYNQLARGLHSLGHKSRAVNCK